MSELSPSIISFEELANNKNLLYFVGLDSDERLNFALEQGTHSTEFACSATSRYTIHPTLLPPNHLSESGIDTSYIATGYFDQKDDSVTFRVHLKADAGESMSDCIVEQLDNGLITIYSTQNPDYIETISPEEFFKLSLCAADLKPEDVDIDYYLEDHPSSVTDTIKLWEEIAVTNHGIFSTYKTTSYSIANDPLKPVEIRFGQSETELPDRDRKDLIIEHVTQLKELDAQIIYRLELSYESVNESDQSFNAHKRVVSGYDRVLSRAQLSTENANGIITKLNINDASVMKQFQVAIEMALVNLSKPK